MESQVLSAFVVGALQGNKKAIIPSDNDFKDTE